MENAQIINIPFYILLLVGAVISSIIFFLVALVLRLSKKVKSLSKMRYGFGGKPIFSIIVFVIVLTAIPLTLFAASKPIQMIKEAGAQKEVLIEVQDLGRIGKYHTVSFYAVPYFDEVPWAEGEYDVYWQIRGDITFEKTEENRSIDRPSYFEKKLISGDYTVKVIVEGENFRVQKIEKFTLN